MANWSTTVRNEAVTNRAVRCNSGFIKVYTGPKPANANTAITTQTLLVTLDFSATAFGAPSNGVATANAITGHKAVADGTAAWARLFQSDGVTVVGDVTAGTSGTDMILDTTQFVVNATINCTNMTISEQP